MNCWMPTYRAGRLETILCSAPSLGKLERAVTTHQAECLDVIAMALAHPLSGASMFVLPELHQTNILGLVMEWLCFCEEGWSFELCCNFLAGRVGWSVHK